MTDRNISQRSKHNGTEKAFNNLILLSKEGSYTRVTNEFLEFFMNRKNIELTGRQASIIFFLVRHLQGWDYRHRPIEIAEFAEGTGIDPSSVKKTLKEMVQDLKLLEKIKVKGFRTPCYGFNQETIGRIMAISQPRKYFKNKTNVIDLIEFKLSKGVNIETLKGVKLTPFEEVNMTPQKDQKAAASAGFGTPKDTKDINKTQGNSDFKDSKEEEWVPPSPELIQMFPQFFSKSN